MRLLQEALDQSELLLELRRLYQGQKNESSTTNTWTHRYLLKRRMREILKKHPCRWGQQLVLEETAETLETPEVLDTQETNQDNQEAVPQDTIDGDSLESQHSSDEGHTKEGSEQSAQEPSSQHLRSKNSGNWIKK